MDVEACEQLKGVVGRVDSWWEKRCLGERLRKEMGDEERGGRWTLLVEDEVTDGIL